MSCQSRIHNIIASLVIFLHLSCPSRAKPVVSFRLDDVQSWWCEDIAETVMNLFISEGVPLNVGIIGEYLDQGGIGSYLLSIVDDPLIEMTSHSFKHESFNGQSYTWQYGDMEDANTIIMQVTTSSVNSFITPYNEYDDTTIAAALDNDMTVFSAECQWSLSEPNVVGYCKDDSLVVAPDIVRKGVNMLPAGAVLGGEGYWQDFLLDASLSEAINWVELQIDNQGFSVVMLHPVEFAYSNDCASLNSDKIQVLKDLIAYGRSRWNFQTFTNAANIITGDSGGSKAPTTAPSAPPPTPTLLPVEKPTTFPTVYPPTPSPTSQPDSGLPVVSFRLDDVQAWWCEDIAETVMNLFISEGVPLNVGIIGEYLDQGGIGSYLLSIVDDPLIEMTSHSFKHESFNGQSYTWQYGDMEDANTIIMQVTTSSVNSFITPYNEYDDTTIAAALDNDMTVFSAECQWSLSEPNVVGYCKDDSLVVAPDIVRKGVNMLPAGAVLGGEGYWQDFLLDASLSEAINWVELQIDNQGFSVVMLHPVEFAYSNDCASLNSDKIQVLKDLIAYGRSRWNFQTFTNAANIITGDSGGSKAPTTAPSAPPPTPTLLPVEKPTTFPTVYPPTPSPTSQPDSGLPVVSFRLDDVQAWWCEDIAETVMNLFISEGVPLNVGIIGEYLDQGGIGSYLLSIVDDPLIEMTSHSFKHELFVGKSYAWQYDDLTNSDVMISSVTSSKAKSFIPPYNDLDSVTVDAAKSVGINILSPQCSWNPSKPNTIDYCTANSSVVAPNIQLNDMYMLPAGAVLGGLAYWEDYHQPANLADSISWIEAQIDNQGFGVVMLHPAEFASTDECSILVNDKLQVLKDLFTYGRSRWQFKTFKEAANTISSSSFSTTPSALPSKKPSAPTIVPSPSPSQIPSVHPVGVTNEPSCLPSNAPTMLPTGASSGKPSNFSSSNPSRMPIAAPSPSPSQIPSVHPVGVTNEPSCLPSNAPTMLPTGASSGKPSNFSSSNPSRMPIAAPSPSPSQIPSVHPVGVTNEPSCLPSNAPTMLPTGASSGKPSNFSSSNPSRMPIAAPSPSPSQIPSVHPVGVTNEPSCLPSNAPTMLPTGASSGKPSNFSSSNPSRMPIAAPSPSPSQIPSVQSTTGEPSSLPSRHSHLTPTAAPSPAITSELSPLPTLVPSLASSSPSVAPSTGPKESPSVAPSASPLPVVSFRLDNVQAYWCEGISETLIDTFIAEGVPVTVGLLGAYLDRALTLDTYLAGVANDPMVEMSSNSYQYDTYQGQPYAWQSNDMDMTSGVIEKVTSTSVSTFIPPYSLFDSNTLSAARDNGINIFSAQCSWSLTTPNTPSYCDASSQVIAPNIQRDGLYMLPTGAVLGDESYWIDNSQSASLTDAIKGIENQIANQGFSVVMLNPVEFATTTSCVDLNADKVNVLKDLFAYGRGKWQFETLQSAAKIISAGSPTAGPTTSSEMSKSESGPTESVSSNPYVLSFVIIGSMVVILAMAFVLRGWFSPLDNYDENTEGEVEENIDGSAVRSKRRNSSFLSKKGISLDSITSDFGYETVFDPADDLPTMPSPLKETEMVVVRNPSLGVSSAEEEMI